MVVLRWYLLIRELDMKISYWQGVKIIMLDFFNTHMPRAVSGNAVKTYYLNHIKKLRNIKTALMTKLLNRIMVSGNLFL